MDLKALFRFSCATVLGCVLASTAHLIASPDEYATSIHFAPCAEDATLDCGTLNVPIDYDKPHGKTVAIAVIRAGATNAAKRIGILVGNPGGPGVSGVDFLLGVSRLPVMARLRQYFDVVSFDPRGVSRSRGVACPLELTPIPQHADDDTLANYFDDVSRRFAQACLDHNGSFVTHIGTMNVARDTDLLRRALGERQISYAAGSYGTVLGAAYASLFPERVRAMMLDGAVAPQFRDYLRVDETIGGLFPRFFGRFFIAFATAPCGAWPAGEPVAVRNVRHQVETPFVIIGNDFDSRTPLSDARSLAHALGMERGVIRYAGSGHTAFFATTACIQDTVVEYLVKLRLPREGFTCPGQPVGFESSQRLTGPTATRLLTIPETRPWRPRSQP
jgi:pimeloyl-ACP methyl ester carboxylesterase